MSQRKALGRGLDALIPAADPPRRASPNTPKPKQIEGGFFICPIERIIPQRGQPRSFFDEEQLQELAQSLREQGVVQPLIVREIKGGLFELIAGERRWRAAQKAGLHEVPVVVRNADDLQAFELALVENLQRQDLNPVEEAQAYLRLLEEYGYTQEQLAERMGKDRSTIANSLRLLKLPEVAQRAVIAGVVSGGHARALLTLEKTRPIQRALKNVIDKNLSVRQTEDLVRKIKHQDEKEPKAVKESANIKDLERRLSRSLKTKVSISGSNNKGKIEIRYASLDELDRLLEVLL